VSAIALPLSSATLSAAAPVFSAAFFLELIDSLFSQPTPINDATGNEGEGQDARMSDDDYSSEKGRILFTFTHLTS